MAESQIGYDVGVPDVCFSERAVAKEGGIELWLRHGKERV